MSLRAITLSSAPASRSLRLLSTSIAVPWTITVSAQTSFLTTIYSVLDEGLDSRGFFSRRSNSLRLSSTSSFSPREFVVSAQTASFTSTYSVSDEDLESRGFVLRRTTSDLNLDHLNSVFVAVGFPKRDTDKIKLALENTDALIWIEYRKTFNGIIWDVVVDPSFQGLGLGKAVMERLIEDLLGRGICNIALYSEPRVLGFYRPMGFVADPDGIRGMVYSRKQKQKKWMKEENDRNDRSFLCCRKATCRVSSLHENSLILTNSLPYPKG